MKTPEYYSWSAMIGRCYYTKHKSFHLYGGRGISVCDSWREFANFLRDMGIRPKGCTLDRIDPNGNYEAGNCRWATWKEQSNNRRPRRPRKDVKGYTYRADCNKFQAKISIQNRTVVLGCFSTPQEAHDAWKRAWEKKCAS